VPHAPYSVSEELWNILGYQFNNKVISIHNQETVFEDELFLQGTGDFMRMYEMMKIDNSFYQPSKKSSLQTYFNKLAAAASVILVHNTFTKQEDIDYAKQQADLQDQLLSFCLCTNANLYIEKQLPPVEMLKASNCNIVIGTDSLASNWSLNVLDELKTIQTNSPAIALQELLSWGTINGAKALRMDEKLGSFEKGKQPGVVLIEKVKSGKIVKSSTARRVI
jgi:cytosine/adenosine deaminase-related metal-dependent hydrolase